MWGEGLLGSTPKSCEMLLRLLPPEYNASPVKRVCIPKSVQLPQGIPKSENIPQGIPTLFDRAYLAKMLTLLHSFGFPARPWRVGLGLRKPLILHAPLAACLQGLTLRERV